MKTMVPLFVWPGLFLWIAVPAHATASLVEAIAPGVHLVRDDNGQWGGTTQGITHQNRAGYLAKKILDLSDVPESVWEAVQEVRLSAYFCVRDYSWFYGAANGLDEAFEVVINGKVHTYPTNCGAPVMVEGKPMAIAWYDFLLPKEEFLRGRNEIIFRKAEGPKADDYLYLGIDTSVERGNSAVSFDNGQTWTSEKLTVPGGRGEYMVRLVLLSSDRRFECVWRPGVPPSRQDPANLLTYAGARGTQATPKGLLLQGSVKEARLEWDPKRLDVLRPVTALVETGTDAPFSFAWLDENGNPMPGHRATGPRFSTQLPAPRTLRPSGLVITATEVPVILRAVTLQGTLNYHPIETPINLCPTMAPPAGAPARRRPNCRLSEGAITLENATLRCRFTTQRHLRLTSLFNEWAQAEMVRLPDQVDLFVVEVEGKRFSGSRDFECRSVRPLGKSGFVADLHLPHPPLKATMTANAEQEGLRLALTVTNEGKEAVNFKLAFPHLAGLAISPDPAGDTYFYPWGGGIMADRAAYIRRGYGDHGALYQVMDLFSPSRGAGLWVRTDDTDGRYKVLALRKSLPGRAEENANQPLTPTRPEYTWESGSLDPVPGTGFAYEYLRRTRVPGDSFSPPPAVLAAHSGDWHVAMRSYADWAHRVWKFRPYPSRLDRVVNMIAVGWGQSPLFKEGRYRMDFLEQPGRDCLELMSWWEWSPLGPWRTPWEKLEERIGKAAYERYKSYWVKDPLTGQLMYPLNRGDYDGYNQRWGGLPALRKAIADYKAKGALVTLYTDPILACDNTKLGQRWGELYGVVGADGNYVHNYHSWNMCHDVAEYRQYVADTMQRVLRETGADGIRLDEYGHKGWACFNTRHTHTFAETGCTEWQRAIAETTKMVRAAMDEVDPRSVLTTEHPGYDYLMQFIEGCITYDLTVQASPLRPLECNLQRFYFPECKPYELDHRGADRNHHKRFWNGVGSFGSTYPERMYAILQEYRDAFSSRACEPLIPTLAQYVYANRFGTGRRTLWTVYNATGHTFEGPVLEVSLRPGERVVDLLTGEECSIERHGKVARVHLYLPREGVACLTRQ